MSSCYENSLRPWYSALGVRSSLRATRIPSSVHTYLRIRASATTCTLPRHSTCHTYSLSQALVDKDCIDLRQHGSDRHHKRHSWHAKSCREHVQSSQILEHPRSRLGILRISSCCMCGGAHHSSTIWELHRVRRHQEDRQLWHCHLI